MKQLTVDGKGFVNVIVLSCGERRKKKKKVGEGVGGEAGAREAGDSEAGAKEAVAAVVRVVREKRPATPSIDIRALWGIPTLNESILWVYCQWP